MAEKKNKVKKNEKKPEYNENGVLIETEEEIKNWMNI